MNLLDFGAIRVFQANFVRGVIDLFEAVRDNDDAKAHHAYETWGFTDLSQDKMDVLNLWAHFLYEPLMPGPRPPHSGERRSAVWPRRGGAGPCGLATDRRGEAAAGIRPDGPFGHRAGRGIPPAEGGAELVPAVPSADRGFRPGGAGRTAGEGAGRGRGSCRAA